MHRMLILILGVVCAAAAPGARPAAAAPAGDQAVSTYALVVGSNLGGPGQASLHYAELDAVRVAQTLRELGGYPADAVEVVVHPTADALRARLGQLAARVAADRAAGRQARVLFYYSGHARAVALDLGRDELGLDELRQRLTEIPASLLVVVLDACQSGAFSRIKGAGPAADFSFSSRQRLDATGLAVLASSSGSELSQESEQLGSSYFTHHLLVGLRGAGDANGDGQVSLDEAYQYAYHQTLLATAETAVGGQHVSLEVDLKGHGEVALSYPRAATAAIELPASLEGQTLVEDRRAHTVVAETYKAAGAAVRIAVAPGDYQVLVRHAGAVARCRVTPGTAGGVVASVELARCSQEPIVSAPIKGEPPATLRLELGGVIGPERADDYTRTLGAFGYKTGGGGSSDTVAGLALAGLWQLERRLWVGGFAHYQRAPHWTMPTERHDLDFTWSTLVVGAVVRGVQPLGAARRGTRAAVYAQLGAGLSIGHTELIDQDAMATAEQFFGWATMLGAGIQIEGNRGIGFALGYQFDYAPTITNLAGDTHASGGHRLALTAAYTY